MNQKVPQMNKLGIDKSKPNFIIVFILVIVVAIEIGLINTQENNQVNEVWKSLDALILVVAWFALLTTPLVEFLRNIYTLITWMIICLLWYIYKEKQDFLSAILPFFVLLYSQISRLLFRSIMGYHPIHLLFNQFAVHRYSKLNKRKSTKIDFWYSVIYSLVGIFSSTIAGIVNLKK